MSMSGTAWRTSSQGNRVDRCNLLDKIRRVATVVVAALFMISLMIGGAIDNEFVGSIRVANPEDGKVIPYHVKGIIVYLTNEQYLLTNRVLILEIALGIVAYIFLIAEKAWPTKK